MRRLLIVAISAIVIAGGAACSKEHQEPQKTASAQPATTQIFVDIVKSQKLPLSKAKTVGEVFAEYGFFSSREWKASRNAEGNTYVDFRGMLTVGSSVPNGVSRHGVEVKFVINGKGDMYIAMVSRIDHMADGTLRLYPLGDSNWIVESIYANKEIKF